MGHAMNLMTDKVPLIIPVENQVRELDAKLLLACIAARRGFVSFIGPRREFHFKITSFPRGIYLSKSITGASDMMFRIMRHLGHEVVAWDEEALVHLPAETYYSRRLSPGFLSGRWFLCRSGWRFSSFCSTGLSFSGVSFFSSLV